jgi:predicted transcriptional regulator of viral defense system
MSPKRRSHRELADLAAEQHGVVTLSQLCELGYPRRTIKAMIETERLHVVSRAAYAVGHAAISRHGRSHAAVLSCGKGALLSHRSAAWLWGMTKRFCLPVEVTAASPRETRPDIRVHSAAALTAQDQTFHEGIPVTAVPRTLLDFAAVDHHYLGQALDNAHRLGLLDLIAMDELISRSEGFRGVARLRTALAIHRPTAFTRSGLERRFLDLVQRAGLPRPSMNLFLEGHELDAYWPAQCFAVELDTYDHHGTPDAFEADRLRQENLKLAGIEMTRITGVRMDREPTAVMRRLRRLLSQRTRELLAIDG